MAEESAGFLQRSFRGIFPVDGFFGPAGYRCRWIKQVLFIFLDDADSELETGVVFVFCLDITSTPMAGHRDAPGVRVLGDLVGFASVLVR